MNRILFILAIFIVFSSKFSSAQVTGSNVVSSAVPFLTIAPDSRGGAMGDAGAATLPDINSQYWNPAKYAFIKSTTGVALSYTPWLTGLGITDMNLAYLVGYHKIDDMQTFSGSIRYFDLGEMLFFDNTGGPIGNPAKPNEFSIDLGYTLKLSDNWSGSVAPRFILSDIYSGSSSATGNTTDFKAGTSFAADVAFYYNKSFFKSRKESSVAYGINISNIGSKISYDGGKIKDFIPTNMKIGGSYTTEIDKYNKVSFALDFNKLLVPTFPVDSLNGTAPSNLPFQDKGPIEGIFMSFSDAPNGLKEELQEITLSIGAEYWYSEQFALRAGYFHEPENKGNRKYLTFGAGLKMNVFSIDFSYIYTLARRSPLENTIRFTLGFDLDNFRNQGKR